MTTTCEIGPTCEADGVEVESGHGHGDWFVVEDGLAVHVTRDELKRLCAALAKLHAGESPGALKLRLGTAAGEGSEINTRVRAASIFLWE